MTPSELTEFMKRWKLSTSDLADILGVTVPAVDHWLCGRRRVNRTVVKVLKLCAGDPKMFDRMQDA